ncbi:MAG TPA: acetyl-CoA carboxylase biotin carboxyl carrier protein [Thermomicrobiales bacterium]|jgi:acetyl-CoA carboxylase biotin carboxyl carrier protein|nr:acetyl-CoA carboxylase biotin carboxyl carrier protein [Thermomicrobiales bacterium]
MESSLDTQSTSQSDGVDGASESPIGETSATIVRTVSDLVDVMGRGGLTELDLDYLDVRIRLRVGPQHPAPIQYVSMESTGQAPPPPVSAVAAPAAAPVRAGHIITAPMVGTFYSAPSPQDPPFVTVGDMVRTGQVIGIIEAMKIMNEITADADGVVAEVVATNATAVEYGSELIRLAPAGG